MFYVHELIRLVDKPEKQGPKFSNKFQSVYREDIGPDPLDLKTNQRLLHAMKEHGKDAELWINTIDHSSCKYIFVDVDVYKSRGDFFVIELQVFIYDNEIDVTLNNSMEKLEIYDAVEKK